MNIISAYRLKYFKIIGLRDGFLCGLKMKKYFFSKIATSLHKKAVKNSPFIVNGYSFFITLWRGKKTAAAGKCR